MTQYEIIRAERVEISKCLGDYYRELSSWYANGNDPELLDTDRSFDSNSSRGKKLLKISKEQFGTIAINKDGYIKIICEYCNKTFIVNNIDRHKLYCDKRPDNDR
jgi:hypothetical protein